MKYIHHASNSNRFVRSLQQLLILLLILTGYSSMAQLSNVPVTGFNNDIVANGVGTSSIVGTTYPAIGMDGGGNTFNDSTFRYSSGSAAPTCYMPPNNLAPSVTTPGLIYNFQSYSGNNAMTITNPCPTYVTNPFSNTG